MDDHSNEWEKQQSTAVPLNPTWIEPCLSTAIICKRAIRYHMRNKPQDLYSNFSVKKSLPQLVHCVRIFTILPSYLCSIIFWPQNLSTYIHTHTRRKVNPKTDCDICAAMHETYICSIGKISTCIQPVLSFRELHSLNRMWQVFLVGWLYLLCTISPSTSIVSFCYFSSLSSFFSTRRTISGRSEFVCRYALYLD